MSSSRARAYGVVAVAASAVGAIALFAFGWIVGITELVNVPGAVAGDGSATGVAVAGALVVTAAWVTVFWRRRASIVVLIAGLVLAVLGTGYLLLLIGSYGVLTRGAGRLGPWLRWGVPAVVVAFALREALGPWGGAVEWMVSPSTGDAELTALGIAAPLVIAGLALTAYYGALVLASANRRTDTATERAAQESERAEALGVELERTRVREQVARELHDSLGQRLTMISFRSDEIETAAETGAPGVAELARSLRAETVRAADDLASIVNDLRTPSDHGPTAPVPTMRGIAELVRSERAAGVQIETMILLDGLDGASDLLHQTVYRLVQEGLTNAVKHAPGASIRLSLDGSPADGVRLRIENDLTGAPGALAGHGAGLGTVGMRERVEQLGGEIRIGEEQGRFIVEAALPWLAPAANAV